MTVQLPEPGSEINFAYEQFAANNETPVILVCGKTGSGKSSLLNALAGAAVREVGVVPTTQEAAAVELDDKDMTLTAYDVAGFGEADCHEARMDAILAVSQKAHIALMVVGLPDRAVEMEMDFLNRLRQFAGSQFLMLPLLVAASRIDLASPRAVWEPESLNLITPRTEKEQNIRQWLDYVSGVLRRTADVPVVPCAAGEAWDDSDGQYGIAELRQQMFMLLPEAARTGFARLARDTALLDARAGQVIIGSAIAAGTAALQPVPAIPDAALIAPIQISMIMALARLHGYDISPGNAIRLIGPMIGTMAGRMVFEQVMKLVPGAGSVMGAAVAATITLSLGQAYHQLMNRNIWNPEKETLLETFTSFWQTNKNLSLKEITLIKQPV